MKVSILVPVYGVERYVGECARTLFAQTYANVEYIFVDDCTPDDSMQVVRQVLADYPHREGQVRMIRHDRNRGLGGARKTALEAATGDFVMNVDSDDYLALDAVEQLVARQQETGADVVSSAFCSVFEDGREVCCREPHYDKTSCLRLMLVQHTLLPHIWARLIRRSLYADHGIASVEGINMAEDLALTPRLIHAARSIAYTDAVTYYYRDDSSASTFARLSAKHVLSFVKANEELWTYFSRNDGEGTCRFALETGMLNVFHQAIEAGFSKGQIAEHLTYRPQLLLFRCLHAVSAHKRRLPLLRLAYLSVKWCYRRKITATAKLS